LNRLLALGFLLVAAGIAVVAFGSAGEARGSIGGFVLIGPFPIVFGTGSGGGELALLSVLLGGLMILLLLLMSVRLRSLTRKGREETDK
jgi:uncharacterized membrane protein